MDIKGQVLLKNLQDDCIKRTRSGRICMPPLARWAGERILTTVEGETPSRYIAPQFIENPVLLSRDMFERHKRMSLNIHSPSKLRKSSRKRECKSEKIKTKNKSCRSLAACSKKNLTVAEPSAKSDVTLLKSKKKTQGVLYHQESSSKQILNASESDHQIVDETKLVRRCLSFDTSPLKQLLSERDSQAQSRQVLDEALNLNNPKDNIKNIEKDHILIDKMCTDVTKEKSYKTNYLSDSQCSSQRTQKVSHVKATDSKSKIQLQRVCKLSSSSEDDGLHTTKMSSMDYCRKLRAKSNEKAPYTKTRSRNAKPTKTNCIYSSSNEDEVFDTGKKIIQKKNYQLRSKVSSWLKQQEDFSVPKHSSKVGTITNYADCDLQREINSSVHKGEVHLNQTFQIDCDSNSEEEKQELSNQKAGKIESDAISIEQLDDIKISDTTETLILEQQPGNEGTKSLHSEFSDETAALTNFKTSNSSDCVNVQNHSEKPESLSWDESSDSDNLLNCTFVIADRNNTLVEKDSPAHNNKSTNFKTVHHKNKKDHVTFSGPLKRDVLVMHKSINPLNKVDSTCKDSEAKELRPLVSPVKKIPKLKSTKLKTKKLTKQKISTKHDHMSELLNTGSMKIPGKNTLKLRKWVATKLEEFNKEHDDDLFEGKKEFDIKKLLNLEDILGEKHELDVGFHTPKSVFQVTSPPSKQKIPEGASSVTPSEFNCDRTTADEYLYKREQLKKVKKNEVPKKEAIFKFPILPTQRADTTKCLNKLLDRLPYSEEENSCSDEEILSDSLNEYHFSDSDESVNYMKNF